MMTLKQKLTEYQKQSAGNMPEEIREIVDKSMSRLQQAGLAEQAVNVGDRVENFSLPDAMGETVNLDEVLQAGPVIISFYRGGWCPYCNMELQALQEALPEIQALGAQLMAISPQQPDQSLSTQEKNQLKFRVLSDTGGHVARSCGLVFALDEELRPLYKKWGADLEMIHGNDKYELPIPSTLIIDTDRTVIAAWHDIDFSRRVEPDEILAVLRQRNDAD